MAEIAKARGVEVVIREGGSHTQVRIGDAVTHVPRHTEINDIAARKILGRIGGKW